MQTRCVLHIINDLNQGGAEQQLFYFLKMKQRDPTSDGLRYLVLTLQDTGVYGEQLRQMGYAVYCADMKKNFFVGCWKLLYALFKIHRYSKPDVIQTWLYYSDFLGLVLKKTLFRKAKLVWNLRCSNMNFKFYSPFARLIFKLCVHQSRLPDALIANSKTGLEYHQKAGYMNPRAFVIPNGFDSEKFSFNPEVRAKMRALLNLGSSLKVIGTFARFDPMKDFATLLEAFSRTLKSGSVSGELKLVLAGKNIHSDNPFFIQQLERLELKNQVLLLDLRNDVPDLLNALDVFVLPSAFGEGCSNILAEAMLSELPCVATDVGDNGFLLDGVGMIVPPQNPAALAEALSVCLKKLDEAPAELKTMGQAAREKTVKHHGLEAMFKRYSQLYDDLCAA